MMSVITFAIFWKHVVCDEKHSEAVAVLIFEHFAFHAVWVAQLCSFRRSIKLVGRTETHCPLEAEVDAGFELVFHANTNRNVQSTTCFCTAAHSDGDACSCKYVRGDAAVSFITDTCAEAPEVEFKLCTDIEDVA